MVKWRVLKLSHINYRTLGSISTGIPVLIIENCGEKVLGTTQRELKCCSNCKLGTSKNNSPGPQNGSLRGATSHQKLHFNFLLCMTAGHLFYRPPPWKMAMGLK